MSVFNACKISPDSMMSRLRELIASGLTSLEVVEAAVAFVFPFDNANLAMIASRLLMVDLDDGALVVGVGMVAVLLATVIVVVGGGTNFGVSNRPFACSSNRSVADVNDHN